MSPLPALIPFLPALLPCLTPLRPSQLPYTPAPLLPPHVTPPLPSSISPSMFSHLALPPFIPGPSLLLSCDPRHDRTPPPPPVSLVPLSPLDDSISLLPSRRAPTTGP